MAWVYNRTYDWCTNLTDCFLKQRVEQVVLLHIPVALPDY